MIPPTSIDGTDITGATIDGTDVQEITVDGDVVFSPGPTINFPVAYSDLVLWYPFDATTYGGSNPDDVTAILGGSGDDTAFDGSVNGATYDSNGGVTDITAGQNSGAYEYISVDYVEHSNITHMDQSTDTFCVNMWVKSNSLSGIDTVWGIGSGLSGSNANGIVIFTRDTGQVDFRIRVPSTPAVTVSNTNFVANQWFMLTLQNDGNRIKAHIDGQPAFDSAIHNFSTTFDAPTRLGYRPDFGNSWDGYIDDYRVYNRELSNSEINQIYQNTKP